MADNGAVFSDKLTKVYMNVPVYLYTLPNGGAALVTIVRHKDNPDEFALHPITMDMADEHHIVNTEIIIDRLPYGDIHKVNDPSIKQIVYTYINVTE